MRRSILFLLSVILICAQACRAEYIRATDEEEIILIPAESEIRMGKSISKDVEKRFGLYKDTFLQERIDDIGQKLAAVSDRRDITYHFKVLEGEELKKEHRINAFALPGGYVYIFKDMVEFMESDDEIAGILAHEIGHIAAKHSVKKLQGSLGAMALNLLGVAMTSDNKTKGRMNAAIGLLMTSYSRKDEEMADKLSVRYVKKAGYDPKAILKTMDKMIKMQREMPIRVYSAYQSHPYYSERKAALKKEVYGRVDFVDFINAPVTPGKR